MTTENTETKTEAQQIEEATALFSVDSTATPEVKDDAADKPVIAAEDAENKEVADPAEETEDEDSDETSQLPKKGDPHYKTKAQRRVSNLANEKNAAVARAEAAERRLAELEAGKPKDAKAVVSADEDARPNHQDEAKYPYGELDSKFTEDLSRWSTRQELKSHEAKQAERAAQESQQREIESYNKKADGFLTLGSEKYSDFADTIDAVRNKEIPMTRDMAMLVLDTPEEGVHVLQHLVANPTEAKEILGKSPLQQAAYFGRIAAKYSSTDVKNGQPAVKVTKAPAPIKGAKGSGAKPSTGEPSEFSQFQTY